MNKDEEDDNITPKELANLIKNRDKKYELAGKDYILITKEEANNRCVLYVSDCEEAIWTKIIDLTFFSNLKKELHLASPLKIFAEHYANSLQTSSSLEKVRTHLKIHIELQIGEGLIMNCDTYIETRVHFNNPDEFKLHLRKFIVYLWQVKRNQMISQKDREQAERKAEQEKQKLEKEAQRSKSLFVADTKSKRISLKHRDLVNPQRKKRKKNGAKLIVCEQRLVDIIQPNPDDDFDL